MAGAQQAVEQGAHRMRQAGGEAQDKVQAAAATAFGGGGGRRRRPGPVGWAAIVAGMVGLAVVSGIALALLSPVLLFFSPILVPLAVLLFLCTAALLTAGGAGVAFLSALSWAYKYLKGKHPPGSHQLDHAFGRIHDTAEHLKHRARDVAEHIPMPTPA